MPINSHIQVPKGVLKYFADPISKKVWYLDIQKGKIRKVSPRKLGCSLDYFSGDMEDFLDANVESPVSKLNKKARDFCLGEDQTITITVQDQVTVKLYVKNLLVRSKFALQSILDNSITAELFNDQSNHDDLVYTGLVTKGSIDDLLKKGKVSLLVNHTEHNLVIPRNGFYSIISQGVEYLIIPISPKGAWMIILQPASQGDDIDESTHYIEQAMNGKFIVQYTIT
ncbi:MAG: hypothetical protein JW811_02735 [Clostridiales bacterium]|nr:hypothetical protein [Clostridiales bacterium]